MIFRSLMAANTSLAPLPSAIGSGLTAPSRILSDVLGLLIESMSEVSIHTVNQRAGTGY